MTCFHRSYTKPKLRAKLKYTEDTFRVSTKHTIRFAAVVITTHGLDVGFIFENLLQYVYNGIGNEESTYTYVIFGIVVHNFFGLQRE